MLSWVSPFKSRDLLCACAVDIRLYLQYYWADLVQTCSLGPLAMSRILSLRLIHAMHALTSSKTFVDMGFSQAYHSGNRTYTMESPVSLILNVSKNVE